MILSDRDIRKEIEAGNIVIDPLIDENIEPSSVDLRLGDNFKIVWQNGWDILDIRQGDGALVYKDTKDTIVIHPNQFVLATTMEMVELPDDISANVLGRSSLGRIGISVHQTAGYIDPGFEGEITLELSNHGPAPVKLYSGDRICQIVFHRLTSPADRPYGHDRSQYQGQSGATTSGMNFE